MALVTFALTLFVSAFLLFLVQPMIGKMILPKLGGTPQVWNTCMVFFQMVLLAGYFYTHAIGTGFRKWKLDLRRQLLVHGVLLFIPLGILLLGPFNITGWAPPPGQNPILSTLLLLLKVVGIPFFVVSTSAPLLQKWFAYTGDPSAKDPYFLYGASNLGSLLSLLAYPFLVEPAILLSNQAWVWTAGYVVLGALVLYCASLVWNAKPLEEAPAAPAAAPETAIQAAPAAAAPAVSPAAIQTGKRRLLKIPGSAGTPSAGSASVAKPLDDAMTWGRRLRWILLAAAPSSLMLGVTSYVSTDLSPFPLLWIIPLSLYLITFILVFGRGPSNWLVAGATVAGFLHAYGYVDAEATTGFKAEIAWFFRNIAPVLVLAASIIPVAKRIPLVWVDWPHACVKYAQPLFLAIMSYFVIARVFTGEPLKATIWSFLGFFIATLACHGELARDRPSPKHLTEFFLWMSFGGMVGGMFNAMFAPVWFVGVAEYPIAIIACALLRPKLAQSGFVDMLVLSGSTEASAIRASNDASRAFNDIANSVRTSTGQAKQEFVPPNTPWLVNVVFDVLLAAVFAALVYWVKNRMSGWGWYRPDVEENGLLNFLRTIGFSTETNDDISNTIRVGQNLVLFLGPLAICCCLMARNFRFGLALASLFLIHLYWGERDPNTRVATRSYFGVLKVLEETEMLYNLNVKGSVYRDKTGQTLPTHVEADALESDKRIQDAYRRIDKLAPDRDRPDAKRDYMEAVKELQAKYTYLMHGTTYHGRNYFFPEGLSRLATTYYHRWGPVGVVMERYNWAPGPQNTYHSDARLPAALVGLGATPLGFPIEQITQAWSEPPIATIGLGTGTMASYVRPFQHIGYYEIDDKIRNFSFPPDESEPHFKYLVEARKRGGLVEVIMGDARTSLEREEIREVERKARTPDSFKEKFGEYNLIAHRDRYYKVMNVDAFSSDAIPVHLLTKEAVELYMSKIADDGVLCLHTSNRHLDLIRPISEIVYHHNKQKGNEDDQWQVVIGSDGRETGRESRADLVSLGHFTSEYVMVARIDKNKSEDQQRLSRNELLQRRRMEGCKVNWTFQKDERANRRPQMENGRLVVKNGRVVYGTHAWYPPQDEGRDLWTDNYSNIISILR